MNAPFPFGFPGPTAMYLSWYVVTLALHVIFMSYVLAGSFYLGISAIMGRGRPREHGTLRFVVQDWLPFSVGLAITAGVAPLLFLQVLYEHSFYSANLLLFHRWMLIVPALIAGFYLLYVLKSDLAAKRRWVWQVAACAAVLCFGFVAWSWTENHLLSRDMHAWVPLYQSGNLVYRSPETLPRLAMWFFGSAAIMATIAGWQLYDDAAPGEHVLVSRIGIGALILGGAAAAIYLRFTPGDTRAVLLGRLAFPYTAATAIGASLMLSGFVAQLQRDAFHKPSLSVITAGAILALLGSGVMREALRVSAVDIESLYAAHARAAEAGGMIAFLLFTVVNAGIVVFAVRTALHAARA